MFNLKFWLASCLLLLSSNSFAFGVSDITVSSRLGEPLESEIKISHNEILTDNELLIQLASKAIYKELNVERSYLSQRLKFSVIADNRIRVFSNIPIKEPFLNFILQFRWPTGELNREYRVFLDP